VKTTIERHDMQIIICGFMDSSPVYIFGPIRKVEAIRKLLIDWVEGLEEKDGMLQF